MLFSPLYVAALSAAFIAALSFHAHAAVSTALHVSGTGASGSDPVLLNQGTEFTVIDNNGKDFNSLEIFLAVPHGAAAPTVSSYDFNGGAASGALPGGFVSLFGTWTPANPPTINDLYSFVGCTACNNSVNAANIDAVYALEGLTVPTSFDVYDFTVSQAFAAKDDFEEFMGAFGLGSIIAPLGFVNGAQAFDTSWTNAGFVDTNVVITPTGGIPEPSTWAMMVAGFALIGALGWRKRTARYAIQ
jgi:hypothetical protein